MSNRILIVEDSPANIQSLVGILKPQGYQLSIAKNGRQALDLLETLRPELILLDIMMPEMDGFETCQRLKASEDLKDIPVIFLTAKADISDIVKGFELGAIDYVAKPFNAHELLARVNTHMTLDQLRRSIAQKNAELDRAHTLVRKAFGRYVSEEVASELLGNPDALELGGEERVVSILMSDLRGFTAMTTTRSAPEVIEILNAYLEDMMEVIARYKGTIDEIIGDAIMVIFGAPLAVPDHATRALACGLDMQRALDEFNQAHALRFGIQLEMGVGIHSGHVVVGNIGSARRTKYAAVGSNVNLVGRIESFTTGGQVLISSQTRSLIDGTLTIANEFKIEPKGVKEPLTVYDITGMSGSYDLSLDRCLAEMVPLDPPLPVTFSLLEEKFVGRTVHKGTVRAASPREILLDSPTSLNTLGNLRIHLPGKDGDVTRSEIYGKVLASADKTDVYRIRLTSGSTELESWLESRSADTVESSHALAGSY